MMMTAMPLSTYIPSSKYQPVGRLTSMPVSEWKGTPVVTNLFSKTPKVMNTSIGQFRLL
jgi:hypothetical protein